MVRARSMLSSVVDMYRRPDQRNLCAPFLNMVIHSYTLSCGRKLYPYSTESLRCISVPGALLAHKIRIIALSSSLMQTEMRAAMFSLLLRRYNRLVNVEIITQSRKEFVLLPARGISSAASTAGFKINHCRHHRAHPRVALTFAFLYGHIICLGYGSREMRLFEHVAKLRDRNIVYLILMLI
jgi:hypothetical protein